jgi:hypothetical protein
MNGKLVPHDLESGKYVPILVILFQTGFTFKNQRVSGGIFF